MMEGSEMFPALFIMYLIITVIFPFEVITPLHYREGLGVGLPSST